MSCFLYKPAASTKPRQIEICQPLFLPVVPHEAVSEVSKGKVHINQKKNVPIRIVYDIFEHFDFFFDILHPNYHQNKYTVTEV